MTHVNEQDPTLKVGNNDGVLIPRSISRLDYLTVTEGFDLEDPLIKAYSGVLKNLQVSASKLMYIFPESYTFGVEQGAQVLFANCLYAVNSHINNDLSTDAEIPLNGDSNSCLSLKLDEAEPLHLLEQLLEGINIMYGTVNDPHSKVSRVNGDGDSGFHLYRFWQPGINKSRLSLYIRPAGEEVYDSSLEYGRNGEGVEASISYVVDTTTEDGNLIELGRHRGASPDNRISIRLDREGIYLEERSKPNVARDPTQEQGTLSLDVGSVLGEANGLGTKIGRFIAFGDILRRDGTGIPTGLNHATHFFSSVDGNASWFTQDALRLVDQMEERRLTLKDIKKLSGRLALGAT